jgi:DNA-binding MarR family transcriptional regulator
MPPPRTTVSLLTAQLVELMALLHSRMAGDTLQIMAETHITLPQMVTLHILHESGAKSVSAVSTMLNLSPSTTSHLIDRLFERGLVTRDEDPTDRRQKSVDITPAGVQLIERIAAARSVQIAAGLGLVEPQLQSQLSALIDLIISQLRSGGPPSCQPL